MNKRKTQKPYEWDSRIVVTGIINGGFVNVYIAIGPFGDKKEKVVMAIGGYVRKMTDNEISCKLCSCVNRAVVPFFDGDIEWDTAHVKERIRNELDEVFHGSLVPIAAKGTFICSDSFVVAT